MLHHIFLICSFLVFLFFGFFIGFAIFLSLLQLSLSYRSRTILTFLTILDFSVTLTIAT